MDQEDVQRREDFPACRMYYGFPYDPERGLDEERPPRVRALAHPARRSPAPSCEGLYVSEQPRRPLHHRPRSRWIDCADLKGSINPVDGSSVEGDVVGPVTSWTRINGKIALIGTLTLVGDPAHTVFATTVTIQKFGGAGKGLWTMSIPAFEQPGGPPTCSEAITSGRLDLKQYDWQD